MHIGARKEGAGMKNTTLVALGLVVLAAYLYSRRDCNSGCRIVADALLRKGVSALL